MERAPSIGPMHRSAPRGPARVRLGRVAAATLLTLAAVALAGCSTGGAAPTPSTSGPVAVAHDLAFADRGGRPSPLLLDACTPKEGTGALPAVVIVHSGSWTEGSHGDLDWLCEEGARHGFAAFTVDYRLLPAAYPDQLEDVVTAVDWIRADAQAKRFRVDPSRVALLGTSAGAGIVAELLTGTPGSPVKPSRFVGGAMLSALYDFTALDQAATDPAELKAPLEYAGCTALDCAKLAAVSAVRSVDTTDPPMFLANSTNELVPQAQATAMAAALEKAGVRHELRIADGTDHAEFIVRNHADIDAAMWRFLVAVAR